MKSRKFHGTINMKSKQWILTECKDKECTGRKHFYPITDEDAKILFDFINRVKKSKETTNVNSGAKSTSEFKGCSGLEEE